MNDSSVSYAYIGKFSSIAAMVRINPDNHAMERASQSRFTYQTNPYFPEYEDENSHFEKRQTIRIGHDVWIGHGAIVLPGRSIGNGAVVGAGAVVTKDVEPYTVVAGNPAKVLRRRFDIHTATRLERLQWWDWELDKLRKAIPYFRKSVLEFLDHYESNLA